MELRPGYKQTELGVLPENWSVSPIGAFTEVTAGGTPNTSNSSYWGGKHPWMSSGELHMKQIYDVKGRITDEGLASSSTKYVPENSVLIGLAGQGRTRGTVAITRISLCTNQSIAAIFPNTTCFHDYLFYNLESRYDELRELSSGDGGRGGLNLTLLKNLYLPIPPIAEQKAIAAALSDVDALLDSLGALITKKRDMKKAAMQELLTGKTRLPGFGADKCYKQTEIGLLPEEWDVLPIGAFTEVTAGGTPNTSDPSYWGGAHPWMSSGELHMKQIHDVKGRITDEGLANSSTKYVPENSVLIGLAGQGRTRGTVAITRISLCTNQSIAAIFPNTTCFHDYLFYNLENRYDELRELSSGDGGRGGLNLTLLKNLYLPIPLFAEQQAIADILSDMDAELEALEARYAKVRDMKTGMMQELLTGKTRLVPTGEQHG